MITILRSFPSDFDAVAMTNFSDASVEIIAIGVESNGLSFFGRLNPCNVLSYKADLY